jgi:hypothetical protein
MYLLHENSKRKFLGCVSYLQQFDLARVALGRVEEKEVEKGCKKKGYFFAAMDKLTE